MENINTKIRMTMEEAEKSENIGNVPLSVCVCVRA